LFFTRKENNVMQEAVTNKRLHPLLTAAAISVTVFSAVGVGAMTGLLPISHSTTAQPTPEVVAKAPEATVPTPPIGPAAVREASEMPPAATVSTPVRKPVKKHVARASVPPPVAQPEYTPAPIAQAPVAAPVEAPKPVPAGTLGVVESVKEVSQPAEKSNGVGPIVGGIAGAVLGNQVGHGTGRTIATVLGAAGGALGGKEIEKNVRSTKHWEVTVRLDDGSYRTLKSDVAPYWHGGERVRLLDGKLSPA
jgi:outer membrane lipoprotein SlyB